MKIIAKPIEMVCWTDESGKVHPVRFKVKGNEGESIVCKVLRTQTSNLCRMAGRKVMQYNCEIAMGNQERLCEIRYDLETCRWQVYKI